MCGIGGAVSLSLSALPNPAGTVEAMNGLLAHRGPDGEGRWIHPHEVAAFAHRRLAIIDLDTGEQPMTDGANWITYNGEIYNYIELRALLGKYRSATRSDTEVVLHAYREWREDCLERFRGMFSFALWDEETQTLFAARDRFGIKPLYYAEVGGVLYFASEIKALLPFLPAVETDVEGLNDYLSFQFCLAGKTLFMGVRELLPGHFLRVRNGRVETQQYWEVYFEPDFEHTPAYYENRIRELLAESIGLHLRADVPLGSYLSGGLDSSIVASLASAEHGPGLQGFTGKFGFPGYDESRYARALAEERGLELHELEIGADDFVERIEDVVYHLDYPVAGPGSFPQFMVSELAAQHRKVVLGGQGGDEIFGGYARYLIAYFEQCIKGAIDGTMHSGNFVVTYESIIPNLITLRQYKPLLQEFWRDGLFEDLDARYFRLINRAPGLGDEIRWDLLGEYSPFETFKTIFHGSNVGKESYFDSMTHFDFKTLLPALLQVEDRVSMAHGLESRVPLLDHPIVELAATMPADVKFKDGNLKHVLRTAFGPLLPEEIRQRKDKMGFPVPLQEWVGRPGPVRDFVTDTFSSQEARNRDFVDNAKVVSRLDQEPRFGRKIWGLLCLELWQKTFHDRAASFRAKATEVAA
ncbi:MAG: asparagine synthase (glutamine-hydrolyzing) [Actinomycetota bacterium]|nr:asparagine synthase (glutamine-hydrolyzing) [Actinomycetota bacterium]